MADKTIDDLRREDEASPSLRTERERNYWQTSGGEGNLPSDYANASPTRAAFLVALVQALNVRPRSILEVGCNVGRNLEALRRANFSGLAGIDVRDCSKEIKEFFPRLATYATFFWEPAATVLTRWAKKYPPCYDLIYSMAALMHMSEDSIMDNMARLSRRHIITIEIEDRGWPLFYSRQYKDIFESLGFEQVFEQVATDDPDNKYIARVFEKII